MTVRQMVAEIQHELLQGDVEPQRGRLLLVKLTALIGNVNNEIREADAAYADVLLRFLDSNEAASRAKIRAETSPEYQRKREAHDTHELITEMSRSLKYLLRSVEAEMELSR